MKVFHHRQRIDELGGTALFVAFDPPEQLRGSLLHGLEVPYPVLVDRERSTNRAWGLSRGSVLRTWVDPGVWLSYAVVDPAGTVVYSRPQRRDDRPSVAELLRGLERAVKTTS